MLKDELEKTEIKDPVQRASAEIKAPRGKNTNNIDFLIESKDKQTKKDEEIKKENFRIFNRQFPGQMKYMLDKDKDSTRVNIFLLPDTYFLTFLVNMLLIIAVLVFFFSTRSVSEEYFIRKNINNVFEKSYVRTEQGLVTLQPFSQITSTETFNAFITSTIPWTVYTDDEEKQLAFSRQNPPLGFLDIRTQHW